MTALEYRLLGSLEVSRGGDRLALGGHKQRSLLALLLLSANRVLTTDLLVEGLWPQKAPAKPLTAIQIHISQLRKLLEPDHAPATPYRTLVTEAAGYRLVVDPGALDVHRLAALFDQAGPALADAPERGARLSEEALALFRGPPLADFAYESWAQAEIGRLEELRLTLLELRVEAGLALGRHRELVGELEALIAEHPLRERPRRQLMLALYRSGRQADALATYQAARTSLVEELGIDPGPELQTLYRAILKQDESLAAPAVGAAAAPDLPSPGSPLLGRAREVAEVSRLVEREDVRLVTLTGPGGIGKTRLALEVAHAAAADGPVHFVALAPVRDPALVLATVARLLGVEESGDRPLGELIAERVGSERLTLVLDNLEQLVDAAPGLGVLVDRCPRLTLLATSRERLRLRAEHEYPVAPLAEGDAVDLFAARARTAAPTARLGDEVTDICRRLDCLPLAIELAAARVRLLEPAAMLRRLDESLPLLTGGPRDAPERQRALRSTIDWSYELLPEDEAALFRRLAVFAGGFTLDAAETVTDADLDGLGSLVDKSLLRLATGDDDTRFSMLQTVREYALDRLEREGEADEMRSRHAQWALELARRAEPHLRTREQVAWHDRLTADQDNLRAALEWSLTAAPELALALAGAVAPFYDSRGGLLEGLSWLNRSLAAAADTADTADTAYALYWLTWLSDKLGESTQREALNGRALVTFRRLGDVRGTVICLNQLARAALERGDAEAATARCDESTALARASGDDAILADSLTVLADIAEHRGDTERALELEQDTLTLRRRLGDRRGTGVSLNALGWALLLGRRYDEALPYVTESASVAREIGDRPLEAYALGNLGLASLLSGDTERADTTLRASLALAQELGLRAIIEEALHGLGGVAAAAGDLGRYVRLSAAAAQLRHSASLEPTPVELLIDERWHPKARAALGEAALEAASTAGRALSVEEAVAYATSAAPPVPPG